MPDPTELGPPSATGRIKGASGKASGTEKSADGQEKVLNLASCGSSCADLPGSNNVVELHRLPVLQQNSNLGLSLLPVFTGHVGISLQPLLKFV